MMARHVLSRVDNYVANDALFRACTVATWQHTKTEGIGPRHNR
jgi:hypothetical protein